MLARALSKALPFALAFVGSTAFAYDFSAADALFARRAEGPAVINQARDAYRAATGSVTGAEKVKAYEMLARLDYYEGLITSDNGEQVRIFERCLNQDIENIKPGSDVGTNPEYYYWKATCLASWGKAKGVVNSLMKSGELVKLLEEGRAVSSSYEGGGFDRISAPVYTKLPAINPFGPRGDINKAAAFIDSALSSSAYPGAAHPETSTGDYFYNAYEYKAEILDAKGDRAGAISVLQEAISRIEAGDLPVGREAETAEHLKSLKALLNKLGG